MNCYINYKGKEYTEGDFLYLLSSGQLKDTDLSPTENTRKTLEEIYKELGNQTKSENVIIKSVYQQEGIQYAKSIDGIFSLRVNNSDKHFGNPFSSVKTEIDKGLIATNSTKESVEKYIDWVINSEDTRAIWIREQLKTGHLKNRPIVYYKELGEPSHATALDYLINNYNWNTEERSNDKKSLEEISAETVSLSKTQLLSDKFTSAQQVELVDWLIGTVVDFSFKNTEKLTEEKEIYKKSFEQAKAQLESVANNPQVKDRIASILEVWDKLVIYTQFQLNNFNIDLTEENKSEEDEKDNEDYSDDKSLKTNPYTKIGPEIKKKFFSVLDIKQLNPDNSINANTDTRRTWFGFPAYKSAIEVSNTVLSLATNANSANEYEEIKNNLLEHKESKKWLVYLFNNLDNSSSQTKIQLARWASKGKSDLKYLQFNKQEKTFEFNNSNTGKQVDTIINNWKNNLIENKTNLFILNENNEFELNKERALEIKANYEEFSDKYKSSKPGDYPAELLSDLKGILDSIGVIISLPELTRMQKYLDTNKILYGSRKNFTQYFIADGGALFQMIEKLIVKENELETFDQNNPLSNNSGVRSLANFYSYYQTTPEDSSYKNMKNDTIWAFTPKKYFTDQFNKLVNNKDYSKQLALTQFSSNSSWLKALNSDDIDERIEFIEYFTINYADGVKDKNSTRKKPFEELTDVELEKFKVSVFQNQGRVTTYSKKRYGTISGLTFSDKKTIIPVQSVLEDVDVNWENNTIGEKTITKLYALFEAEYLRVNAFLNTKPEDRVNLSVQLVNGSDKFIINPWANDLNIDYSLPLSVTDQEIVKNQIRDYYNKLIELKIQSWKDKKIIYTNDKGKTEFLFDNTYYNYINNNQIPNRNNTDQIALFAAIDYEVNTQLVNLNLLQVFAGDPASYFKGVKNENTGKVNLNASINETLTNVGKRLAGLIAPGDPLANVKLIDIAGINGYEYTQVFINDHNYISESIKYITKILDDKEVTNEELEKFKTLNKSEKKEFLKKFPNSESYFNIEATDAQEWITPLEALYNLHHEGKLSDDFYKKAVKRLMTKQELSDEQISEILIQVQKPVYFNGMVKSSGNYIYNDFSYIKTSAFPLLKKFTVGTPLDNLRIQLEKLQNPTNSSDPKDIKLVRMVASTGSKVGSPQILADVWNADGSVKDNIDFSKSTKLLNREGFRVQLEVPPKNKDYVNRGTQEIKQLFGDLLDVKFTKSFKEGKRKNPISGKDFRAEYYQLNNDLFKTQLEILKYDLDVQKDNTFNIKLLRNKLEKEARSRNFSINEIENLRLIDYDSDKGFILPLVFNTASDKFESLLISLVDNSIRKQTQTGYSSPLGSASGFKFQNNLKNIDKSKIVFVGDYDGSTLLKPQRIENGVVKGAQVLAPWKFRDNQGNLLEIHNFTKKGKNGQLLIDTEKLPKELLQSMGFRIPTQGLNSMSYIEIVGFLPYDTVDLLITPPEFTKQMGSDFDIDKLYSYLYNTFLTKDGKLKKFVWNKNHEEEFFRKWKPAIQADKATLSMISALGGFDDEFVPRPLEDQKKNESNLRKVKDLQNKILDIHFEVLGDPSEEVQAKIISALGFGKLGDLKKKYDKAEDEKLKDKLVPNLTSSEYQSKKYLSARAGKALTGYFSSLSTFVSTMQGLDLAYMHKIGLDLVEQRLVIYKKGTGLANNKDNKGGFKTNNVKAVQSAAVDDEKEQILASLRLNLTTAPAIAAWIVDGHDEEDYTSILMQPIMLEYLTKINNANDIFEDTVKGADKIIAKELIDKYTKLVNDDTLKLETYEKMSLSNDRLWESYNKPTYDKEYYITQLSAFYRFLQADAMGKSIQRVINAFNIDSKGLGKSFIEAGIKQREIAIVRDSGIIRNIENLVEQSIGGLSAKYSLNTVMSLFEKYYPYFTDFNESIYNNYFDWTLKNDLRASERESEVRIIYDNIKSTVYAYMLEKNGLDLVNERRRLMFGEESLTKRVFRLKNKSKNPFIKKLKEVFSKNIDDPDTLSIKTIGGELFSEDDLYIGFIELFNDPNTQQLAKDLIDYFYINGGDQKAREYSKYIPTGFMEASGYAKTLRSIDLDNIGNTLDLSTDEFIEYFIRNNPYKAVNNPHPVFENGYMVINKDEIENFTYLDSDDRGRFVPYIYTVSKEDVITNDKKVLKKNKARLYKNIGDNHYIEIPLLGFRLQNYTGLEYGNLQTAFPKNFTKPTEINLNERLPEPINSKVDVKENIPNTEYVSPDFKSLGIKKTNAKEDIKNILNNINTPYSRILLDLVSNNDLGNLTLEPHKGDSSYNSKTNKIKISESIISKNKLVSKILHEVTHSTNSRIINKILENPDKPNFEGLTENQKLAFIRLNKTFNTLRDKINNGEFANYTKEGLKAYEEKLAEYKKLKNLGSEDLNNITFTEEELKYNPFVNLKEFIAEIYSNKDLQEQLNSITYDNSDKTWLEKFIEEIANFLSKFALIDQVDSKNLLAQVLYDGFLLSDTRTSKNIFEFSDKTIIDTGSIKLNSQQKEALQGAINLNEMFTDFSVSSSNDLGMDITEFVKNLNKEDRESFRILIKENKLKTKCN